jgi:hypothetical protein
MVSPIALQQVREPDPQSAIPRKHLACETLREVSGRQKGGEICAPVSGQTRFAIDQCYVISASRRKDFLCLAAWCLDRHLPRYRVTPRDVDRNMILHGASLLTLR